MREAIQSGREAISHKLAISAEEALASLAEVVRDPSHPQRVRAIELAMKHRKLLTDKLELSTADTADLIRAASQVIASQAPDTADDSQAPRPADGDPGDLATVKAAGQA